MLCPQVFLDIKGNDMTMTLISSRRLAAIAIFVCLWTAMLGLNASAAFSDVAPDTWFYEDVTALHEAGIIDGYPDGSFRPGGAVNYAEALKMILGAAGYVIEQAAEGPWYAPYLDYAIACGISDADVGIAPGDPITRDRAAELIVRAMGLPLDVDAEARPFVDSANVYAITLHGAGIIRGEMSGGLFYYRGDRTLNRAELATIVVRMMHAVEDAPAQTAAHPLIPEGCTLPEAPRTVEDFIHMLIYLSVSGLDEQTFIYRGVDVDTVKNEYLPNLAVAYPIATDLCRESVIYYHYYNINLAYARNYVAMTVKLRGRDYTADECRDMFSFTLSAAERALGEIMASLPTESTTPQTDYARACLEWIVTHCRYESVEGMVDQYAYSVFRDGASVCSGYTAAYNLLLKLGGIKCMSMTGYAQTEEGPAPHAWTIAELDGTRVWIDSTWCDPVGQADDAVSYTYFALDEATFAANHTPEWDYTGYWHLLD